MKKKLCEECVRLHAEAERWKKDFAIANAENETLLDERLLAWDEITRLRKHNQILNQDVTDLLQELDLVREELDDAEGEADEQDFTKKLEFVDVSEEQQ